MKNDNIKLGLQLLTLAALSLMVDSAMAQSIGQVANNATVSTQGVTTFAGSFAYGAGVIMAIVAAFKLKAYRDDPRQTPLGTPIILFLVAMLLVYIPTTIETAKDTIWTGGATTQGTGGQVNIQ